MMTDTEKLAELLRIIVSLKRSLDRHETDKSLLTLPAADWADAVARMDQLFCEPNLCDPTIPN